MFHKAISSLSLAISFILWSRKSSVNPKEFFGPHWQFSTDTDTNTNTNDSKWWIYVWVFCILFWLPPRIFIRGIYCFLIGVKEALNFQCNHNFIPSCATFYNFLFFSNTQLNLFFNYNIVVLSCRIVRSLLIEYNQLS